MSKIIFESILQRLPNLLLWKNKKKGKIRREQNEAKKEEEKIGVNIV
jgi:hypothetical protein